MTDVEFPTLSPDLQVSFYYRLVSIRERYLQSALQSALDDVELKVLDAELAKYAALDALKKVARFGIRGEVVFPTPVILQASPFLLGYYRLLFGLSQKEFYHKGPFGRFKKLEESGVITPNTESLIAPLCISLNSTASKLVDGLDDLSIDIVHELQLLTIGPQLRGSENTRIGETSIQNVFDLIRDIIKSEIQDQTRRSLRIQNAAGRSVLIEFGADPDVFVTEKVGESVRHVLSIEVKGGGDASNVHNRLGEAEKSHLKAKNLGCTDLWTILRVDVDDAAAQRGSPTTTRFFNLDRILNRRTRDFRDFREEFCSRIGLPL